MIFSSETVPKRRKGGEESERKGRVCWAVIVRGRRNILEGKGEEVKGRGEKGRGGKGMRVKRERRCSDEGRRGEV